MRIGVIVGLFLFALVTVFAFQNTEVVTLRFLFWQFSLSRALLVFVLLILGVVAGWLLRSYRLRRVRRIAEGGSRSSSGRGGELP